MAIVLTRSRTGASSSSSRSRPTRRPWRKPRTARSAGAGAAAGVGPASPPSSPMPPARRRTRLLVIALCALCLPQAVRAQTGGWAQEMAAFSAEDQDRPFAEGGILFVGSSSIRLWDLQRSFPGVAILNRGFGGSHISDSIAHVDRLI